MQTYIVTAVCFGTITETWRVTSPTPLDHATIKGVIEHEDDPAAGASFTCVNSTAGDEQQREVAAIRPDDSEIDPTPHAWPSQSAAFRAEKPWCGWMLAFSDGSDCDTVATFGMTQRLENINMLLTTADGRSRPVRIINARATAANDVGAIETIELDDSDPACDPFTPERREIVRYEDIREVVVF